MVSCPVCKSISLTMHPNTPYHICPKCDLWFQSPLPKKVYEAPQEKSPEGVSLGAVRMDEQTKGVNRQIANVIFNRYLGSKPAKIIDIGSKFPYLAH